MRNRLALLGGLFLVLVVGLVVLPPSNERQVPLTVYSAEPGGGKALRLWLESLGHPVSTLEGGRYAVGPEVQVVLLLAPSQALATEASGELERWTRQGGRLVVATDGLWTYELLNRFDVTTRIGQAVTHATPADGAALDPAIRSVTLDTRVTLNLDKAKDAVPLLVGEAPMLRLLVNGSAAGGDDRPVVAARVPAGRGELVMLTAPALLSNDGLRTDTNARLALALLGPDRRARVAIDEVHHGFGILQRRSLFSLLLEQAWGRALFIAGGIVLCFLLWCGRRFGRAVPVFVDRGRSLGELVSSQAGLYRAGGKRAFVAAHLARQLRQEVAQTVGLPGTAPDAEIAARAAAIGRDPASALGAIARIGQARSDGELLAATRDGERARADLVRTPALSPRPDRSGDPRRNMPAPPLRAGRSEIHRALGGEVD